MVAHHSTGLADDTFKNLVIGMAKVNIVVCIRWAILENILLHCLHWHRRSYDRDLLFAIGQAFLHHLPVV